MNFDKIKNIQGEEQKNEKEQMEQDTFMVHFNLGIYLRQFKYGSGEQSGEDNCYCNPGE